MSQTAKKSDKFDWLNDEVVVVQEQPATAVYSLDSGLIAIRQQANPFSGQDAVIVLTPENAVRIAHALSGEAHLQGFGLEMPCETSA